MSWRLCCVPTDEDWPDAIVTEENAEELAREWVGQAPMHVYVDTQDNAAFQALRQTWHVLGWDWGYSAYLLPARPGERPQPLALIDPE